MESLRDMLVRHEGWKLKPYRCPAGKKTIGVGWNIDANTLPPDIASHLRLYGEITNEMVERLLTISLETATKQCEALYTGFNEFSERRKNALIDFVFNVGVGTAVKFRKMRAAVILNNWGRAAEEMVNSTWYTQVGNRSKEIVKMIEEG